MKRLERLLRSCGWSVALLVSLVHVTACNDPTRAPAPGSIQVSVNTTGLDLDPDGYFVLVDGDSIRALGSNGSLIVSGVTGGPHTVRLGGVATNCAVGAGESRTVVVTDGKVTALTFAIGCVASEGTVAVTVTATGTQLPLPAFRVAVDDNPGSIIAANGTVTHAGLRAGLHVVWLRDLAPTCRVNGPNPTIATVAHLQTTNVVFSVTCDARIGTIRITTTTTGPDRDSDGYTARVTWGGATISETTVAPGSTVDVEVLTRDGYIVSLVGVAPNCMVDAREWEGTIRQVDVKDTSVLQVSFAVTCERIPVKRLPPGTRLAFVREGRIYSVNSDGTDEVRLTDGPNDSSPAWSPDGRRIAFARGRGVTEWGTQPLDIYVMDADGSNLVRRTQTGYNDEPAWSPDGKRIAFTCVPGTGSAEICVMSATEEGSGPTVLMDRPGYDAQPAWTPDGKIAFVSDWRFYDFVYDVYIMNADGSDVKTLMEGPAFSGTSGAFTFTYYFQPAWSLVGHKIAVAVCKQTWYFCDSSTLAVLDFDGYSGLTTLANTRGYPKPAWSPDGRTIAYSTAGTIRWVRADGSDGGIIVTNGHSPSWRP